MSTTNKKNNKPNKSQGSFLDMQMKKLKRDTEREARKARVYDDEDVMDDLPEDESNDGEDAVVESTVSTFKLFGGAKSNVGVKSGRLIFHVGGKNVSSEVAFNTMNSAAYIAALYIMNNPDESKAGDMEMFIASAIQMIGLYGPLNDVSFEAVHASVLHIVDNGLDPYEVVRQKKEEIRNNLPRAVNADAVVTGVTAMDMDLSTQEVEIQDHEDLAKRSSETMGLLNQAVFTQPGTAALDVVAEIGDLNAHLQPIAVQLQSFVDGSALPDINETNPFRKMTNHYGLMSPVPVAVGTHGLLQEAYLCLKSYMDKPPDVMLVPGYNQTLTGSWKSHTSASRVIPMPDDSKLASMALFSIVAPYDEGLRRGAEIEAMLAEEKDKKTEANARSILHAPFEKEYARFKQVGVGKTSTGVSFVTIYGHKPLSKKKFLEADERGLLVNRPALMRAADYYQIMKTGQKGEFVFIDMPAMLGLFFTGEFIATHFRKGTYSAKTLAISPKRGWYVFAAKLDRYAKTYATLLSKYMFCFLSARVTNDSKVYGDFYRRFFGSYSLKPKNNATALGILGKLESVFGKIVPSMTKVTILFPGYSPTKAFKYSTAIVEAMAKSEESSDDDVLSYKKKRLKTDFDIGGENSGDDVDHGEDFYDSQDDVKDSQPTGEESRDVHVESHAESDPQGGENA